MISQETAQECIDTLRHLDRAFKTGCRIDTLDMDHVTRALVRVDIEQTLARRSRIDAECAASRDAIKQAAE